MSIAPVSLLNFDQTRIRDPIINSPRSLDACRRQGIRPEQLVMKTMHDIKQENRHLRLDEEAWIALFEHNEDKRQARVQVCIEEREEIIMHGRNNYENEKFESMNLEKEKKKL